MGSLVQPPEEGMEQQVNMKALIQGVNAARRKCTEAQAGSSVSMLRRQARRLLELVSSADNDNLTQLVVHGGVEAVLPLLTLADRTSLQLEDVSKYACAVLAAVAAKPEHKELMTQSLPGLFKLMQPHSRNTSGARWAADAVAAWAQDSRTMQEMLREVGGIELLVQLLDAGDPRTQRSAAAALRAACGQKNEANMRHLLQCDALPKLVKLLQSKETTVHNKALQLLGDLTHSRQQMRQAALQAGAMAPIIRLLSSSSSSKETQRAAALLVGQFAAPPLEEPMAAGLGQSAIPALVRLLASQEPSVQELAAFAVARLAQLPVNQAALIAAESLPPLLGLLNSPVSTIQYNAAFALYELAACKEHSLPVFHKAGGLQHLYVCSQRLQRGPTKACVDRTILCLEQHKAAASRGAAADAAASSDTAATAPEAEGITLAPLQLLAPSVDPEEALRSPLALPAATLFGKAWPGTDDASGSAAVLAIPAQPLRLPTIDEIVAEAAAATAAEVAAEGSAAAQLLLLQQQQQQRALTPASLTELRQRAVAVELRLQLVQQQQQQQQQQPVSGLLLKLAVARRLHLCKQAAATAQAQQLAACALAQRHDLLQPDRAGAEASAASAAARTLAAVAAAEAGAVSALFKVLMLHSQQGIPASLLLQIRSSNGRWARAVRQLADAAEQHVQPDCQAGSNLVMRVATSAALLVLLAAAAVGAHQRHGPLDVDAALSLCKLQAVPAHTNMRMPAGVAAPAAAAGLLVLAMLALVLFLLRRPRARSTPVCVAVPGEREHTSGLAGGGGSTSAGRQQEGQQQQLEQPDAASSKDAGGSGRDQDAGRKHSGV